MNSGWEETLVGEWSPFIYGKNLPDRNREDGPIPVFGSAGIVGWHRDFLSEGPGIIIGRKGTVGHVEYCNGPFWAIDTTYFVEDARHRDIVFTATLLSTLGLEHRNSHSAVPGLSREDVHSMEIKIPSLHEQVQIGKFISLVNTQIQTNKRILETINQLIATYCTLSINNCSSNAPISLTKAARLVNGGAYTKGASESGRMVIRIKELNSGPSISTIYNNIEVPKDKTAFLGDVLFAWSGSLGIWRWYGEEAIVNQHIFKVLPNKHPVWLNWFHIEQELETFQDIASGKATTMGHITQDHLDRTLVADLTDEEMKELSLKVEPLWEYQKQVALEIRELAALKKFIFPQLIKGGIEIPSSHKVVEGV